MLGILYKLDTESNNLKTENHKITILGAGPAGMSCALFLAQRGIPTLILEKNTHPRNKTCGDALSGKVISTLKHLEPNILTNLNTNSEALGCWGIRFVAPNGIAADIPFKRDYRDTNPDILPSGFIMKRINFDYGLFQKCLEYPSITVKQNCKYETINKRDNGFNITTSDGTTLNTELIVCADGAHSTFARQFGKIKRHDTHYCGSVRAYFKNVNPINGGNFLELYFIKGIIPGYLWIFPLPNGQANIGLGLRSDYIKSKRVNLKNLLIDTIKSHPTLRERLKNAEMIDTLEGFGIPLGSKKRQISGDNYLLLGDAASLVDPFTGEGISNAIQSGKIASEIIYKNWENATYSGKYLKEYDQTLYSKIGNELRLSKLLQDLSKYPFLMNLIIKKANKNKEFRETITSMFDNINLREKFKDPMFYMRLLK